MPKGTFIMAAEAKKAIARRYFDEFLHQGKGVGGEELFAPTYRSHFPGSPEPLAKKERDHLTMRLFSAFPDGPFPVQDTTAAAHQRVIRYTIPAACTAAFSVTS